MPELPEVETVRRGLESQLLGGRIAAVHQHVPALRIPFPQSLPARLTGCQILRLTRRGKYLLFHLNTQEILLCHLGMSGSFSVYTAPRPPQRHEHLTIAWVHGGNRGYLGYHDPRRFGFFDLIPASAIKEDPRLRRLGPEPWDEAFSPQRLYTCARQRRMAIKPLLLDQSLVAGLGNIYANEALFRAAISPRTAAKRLARPRCVRLVAAVRSVLSAALAAGGSSLKDFRRVGGELGTFQHHFMVYDRATKPCPRCHRPDAPRLLRRIVQNGRSSYYCPGCQH